MFDMIWNLYFYGSPIGFLFSWVAIDEHEKWDLPYLMAMIAFLGWPILLPFVVYEWRKQGGLK